MRITNKIMQNNSIANINTNKLLQDKLNTQLTTQSKIVRPSDDPVVAIRALRLRTNLGEISQYYTKNVPDAKSWLSVTEDALKVSESIIVNMYTECERGAQGVLEPDDRAKLLESLKNLKQELYATGDADYAGKNIFTGYRTDTRLTFQGDTQLPYTITEQLTRNNVDSFKYINTKDLANINETNFGTSTTEKKDITDDTIHRIRLSYANTNAGTKPSLSVKTGVDATGKNIYDTIKVGSPAAPLVIETYSKNDPANNPYELVKANPDKAYYVPETGELLLGKNVNNTIQALPKDQEIAVKYQKSEWEKGDLRPEHYFACQSNPGAANEISFNPEYLTDKKEEDTVKQVISYDVGFNQTLRVNTLANECYTHNIGRDIDELIEVTKQVADLQGVVEKFEAMLKDDQYTSTEKSQIEDKLAAAKKAFDYGKANCQKMFESGMTKMQGYQDQANLAMTNVGNRGARLEMIENRLKSQQTTFKELTDDNEGADITELAIQLSSADLSYNAALLATGKIVQNSLMNFI